MLFLRIIAIRRVLGNPVREAAVHLACRVGDEATAHVVRHVAHDILLEFGDAMFHLGPDLESM